MKRISVLVLVAAFFVVGCKKKEDEGSKKNDPKADPDKDPKQDPEQDPGAGKLEHGKAQGKGTGGGDKTATGTKDSKPGSGKPGGDDRGAYIANVGGCVLCHTPMIEGQMAPDMNKLFAGGMRMKEAFGEWVSPNITPDPETGIGNWTEEQIVASIRDGVRPDGSKLHPIMPWPFYNGMTDDDAKALAAFLKAQPAVVNKIERNKLPELAIEPPPSKRVDPVDDPIGHGAYLATLMHCVMCHTPMTEKGPDFSKAFAGGFEMHVPPEMGTGVIYSSNITGDEETGIGKWSEQDVVVAIREAKRPDGSPIMGPMQMYASVWSQLTEEDLTAVAKYIKSIPATSNKVPAATFKPGAGGPPGGGGDAPEGDPGAPEETGGGDEAAAPKGAKPDPDEGGE